MDDPEKLYSALEFYYKSYEQYNNEMWAGKLGFSKFESGDEEIIIELTSILQKVETDMTIFFIGLMDQWKEVITADSDNAPLILQKTSENLIQLKSVSIIVFAALILWFISKEIFNSAFTNSTNGKALLVSSYVIQTTLIVDGIFIFLAFIQPTLSGLV